MDATGATLCRRLPLEAVSPTTWMVPLSQPSNTKGALPKHAAAVTLSPQGMLSSNLTAPPAVPHSSRSPSCICRDTFRRHQYDQGADSLTRAI